MKINSVLIVVSIGIVTGCMSSNDNVRASSNTIKIIRESKYVELNQRQINTGKIEVVDYNSSVISPERKEYKKPKKRMKKSQNYYGNKVHTQVNKRVSSVERKIENKADTVVNRRIDNAIGQLFK